MSESERLRFPAVPLITVDPYFSVWSMTDRLFEDHTRHWTTARMMLVGMIRVDGAVYRFCGRINPTAPAWRYSGEGETADQVDVKVTPLASYYTFLAAGVELSVSFTTPLLLDDLDILSRPASYVDFSVRSLDGSSHSVELYFDASAEAAVDLPEQSVEWGDRDLGTGQKTVFVGTWEQNILGRRGDDLRIDWGYLHLVAPSAKYLQVVPAVDSRSAFILNRQAGEEPAARRGSRVADCWPVLAATWDLGTVGAPPVERFLVLAYDDVASIEYLEKPLRAYCFRNGATFDAVLGAAVAEHSTLIARSQSFGEELHTLAVRAGGSRYADLCTAAYRQAIAAHKLVADVDGTALFFSKECFSNGCIATVDVSYPSTPLFLLFAPELVKGMLRPIFRYASTPEWSVDYAPHDAGTYPRANGQVYGVNLGKIDAEKQMPVEECGNMLIMVAALARIEGSVRFAADNWGHLEQWARYLEAKGYDPENQLCTDDFAGHLAHNTNLSVKAIVALGAFGDLCSQRGKEQEASHYREVAARFAKRWEEEALTGDHYRLTFDRSDTWSLKYNLIWDLLFGYRLFSDDVYRREIAHYLKMRNRFGVPLDSRNSFTKSDWQLWVASLADSRDSFEAIVAPVWDFLNETPVRTPFCDWYGTVDALERSFHHRSVVGGIFMKLLKERMTAG